MTISGHTSAPALRIPPKLSCVCVLTVWKTPKRSLQLSLPISISTTRNPDRQAGSSRRILNLDDQNCTLPAPDTANTSQVWSRHHCTLTSLWVLGIQTSPHHELFGSAFSLLWSTMTLSQSYCNCRHASKSHLQSLAREKKKQHALAPEWIRSNTHYRSQ